MTMTTESPSRRFPLRAAISATLLLFNATIVVTAFVPQQHYVHNRVCESSSNPSFGLTRLASTAEKTETTTTSKADKKSQTPKTNIKKKKPRRNNNKGGQKQNNAKKAVTAKKGGNGGGESMLGGSPSKNGKGGKSLKAISELKLGSQINGVISGFSKFGAFVKIDYDLKQKKNNGYALLHISQIRDEKVDDPKKLFRIGQKVKGLRVININYAKGEVGLSLRAQRPKRTALKDVKVGSEIEGSVTKVTQYGAFVDIGARVNALVHISRISQRKIDNIRNWINEGDIVSVHIIGKDEKKKTLAASMLDSEADAYLERQSKQKKRMTRKEEPVDLKKSELEYFEDAVKDLEEVFGEWKNPQ